MFFSVRDAIDMQVLKDLKRFFLMRAIAGDRPPRYGKKSVPFTVGRGPVPRRASVEETAWVGVRFSRGSGDRGGQAPALRAREGFFSPCARSGAGAPELQSPAPLWLILL